MKSNEKISIVIVTFALFLLFVYPEKLYFSSTTIESLTNFETQIEKKLKSANYWDLTGSPIYIDDSDPDYRWSKIEAEIVIIIVISLIIIMIIAGIVIFKRKSSREEIMAKNILSSQELKEFQEFEAETSVEKGQHFCVVHRGKIVGPIYLCPTCETYYCMKCATVLKSRSETCWVCNNEIKF